MSGGGTAGVGLGDGVGVASGEATVGAAGVAVWSEEPPVGVGDGVGSSDENSGEAMATNTASTSRIDVVVSRRFARWSAVRRKMKKRARRPRTNWCNESNAATPAPLSRRKATHCH